MNKYFKITNYILVLTFVCTMFINVFAIDTNKDELGTSASLDNYNCGCSCQHATIEECEACTCCKGKCVYKNGENIEEENKKDNGEEKEEPKKEDKKEEPKVDNYNCGCGCRHATIKECQSCPCCKDKDVYKNGNLYEKRTPLEKDESHEEKRFKCEKANCNCAHKTAEELKSCWCCKFSEKTVDIKTKVWEEEYINCDCRCKHKTMEEFNACTCCKGKKPVIKKMEAHEVIEDKEEPKEEPKVDNYNCGCGCHHKTIEECESCPCCKDKDVYKNGKLFKKAEKKEDSNQNDSDTKKDESDNDGFGCGGNCSCKHKTMEEFNACPCCNGNKPDDSKKDKTDKSNKTDDVEKADKEKTEVYDGSKLKEGEYINCGCNCKHYSIEEYNACPCCKGKKMIVQKAIAEQKQVQDDKKAKSNINNNVNIKDDEYVNCGCGCKHKSMKEYNECTCCKGKEVQVKKIEKQAVNNVQSTKKDSIKENSQQKESISENHKMTIYHCGCGCKHKSMEEFDKCICCKGNDVIKEKVDMCKDGCNCESESKDVDEDEEYKEVEDQDEKVDKKTETNNIKDEDIKEIELKDDEYIHCGCGCKHKSMKEFNDCECCHGKEPIVAKEEPRETIYIKLMYFAFGVLATMFVWLIKEIVFSEIHRRKNN